MQRKNVTGIVLCLMAVELCANDVSFQSVQKQYIIALQDLISVYQGMQPPLPIQIDQSDLVGSVYIKIIRPYVVKIAGYSSIVMSKYARKYSYTADLKILNQKFTEYEKNVASLTKLFPKDVQQDALLYFYNELTDSLVQNCAKIVQGLAYELQVDQDSLDNALIAYNLAWQAQTPTMKIAGFADMAAFRLNMTTWMVNLYQAALSHLTMQLQKTNDRVKIYQQMASCYQTLSDIYKNSGDAQKAQFEQNNATKMLNQVEQDQKATKLIQDAEEQINNGRSKFVMNYGQPSDTKNNLTVSLKALIAAQGSYTSALQIYTAQQDSVGINQCQKVLNQLQVDQQYRGVQLLWILFLENAYRQGATSKVKAFLQLQNFYKSDPTKQDFSVDLVVQALSDLLNLCTKAPNDFNTSLAIQPLLQEAITLYQKTMIEHLDVKDQDSLVDGQILHDAQKALSSFITILQGMISLGKGGQTTSGSNLIAQIIVQAKDMDNLFHKNSALRNLFFYFPDLEVDMQVAGKKSFASFVVQYLYRITLNKIQGYMKSVATDAKNDEQGMVLALSDLISLQNYKDYITNDQLNNLQQSIITLATKMDIVQYAQTIYKNAVSGKDWKNSVKVPVDYQSATDSLWNRAIELCEIGIDLSRLPNVKTGTEYSTAMLQKIYVQILTDYITAFVANVPTDSVQAPLHIFVSLYKLFVVANVLKDTQTQSFVQKQLEKLFGGSTGFFAQIKQIATTDQTAAKGSKAKEADDTLIVQLISQINVAIEEQSLMMSKLTDLFQLPSSPEPLLESTIDDFTLTVSMKLDSDHYTEQLINPLIVKVDALKAQITKTKTLAEQAEKNLDFATAMKEYGTIKQLSVSLLPLLQDAMQKQACKDEYFNANTRFTAASLAARIIVQGNQNWNDLADIPQSYVVNQFYLNNVDMKSLGGAIPASLQKLTKATLLSDAKSTADAMAIFKAYLTSQLLAEQGLSFLSCYVDYTLKKQSGVSALNATTVAQVQATVNAYLQQCKSVSVTVSVTGSMINFILGQLPISPVTPVYSGGPYAAVYFVGASTLFAPGKDLIMVGGSQYVPGQDQESYQQMLADIGYAYVSQAQQYATQAQSDAQALIDNVTKLIKAKQPIQESDFMQKYNKIKQNFIRAQALLFIPKDTSCAYAFFNQAGQEDKVESVKKIFLDLYKTQVKLLNQLLIGNPISNVYNAVLSDLNQAYIAWTVELDPVKDATEIAQNYQAVVALFQTAGDGCMNYAYTQAMFPGVQQYHYMKAAANYQAAQKQYASMKGMDQQVAQMHNKALGAYFYACQQKVAVYYFAQKQGLVYTPAKMIGYDKQSSTAPQKVSVAQLFKDYQSFESGNDINQGEVDAYNDLKKLLLDSAMYFQYLGGVYAKAIVPSSKPPLAKTKGASKNGSSLNADLVTYLQSKNIILAKADSISYVNKAILPQLFTVANDVFNTFQASGNMQALADWCNALNLAIAYQYIDDYQGGIQAGPNQASDFQTKWQQFFQAIQKESSALQNPSSSYIG